MAEAVYYFCGNAVGVYSRLLSEIAIRRAFMDRRGYIKSTIKKTYEKDQEVKPTVSSCLIFLHPFYVPYFYFLKDQLLLSILPEHISSKVKEELRKVALVYNTR